MTTLYLDNTTSTITGTLAQLPAGMTTLHLGSTTSTITGGLTPLAARGIAETYMSSMSMTQAQVDDVVSRLYTDRALFTAATPSLQIDGTNAAPTGLYQLTNPPVTGKEKIYWLVNDPLVENFRKWTVTFSA